MTKKKEVKIVKLKIQKDNQEKENPNRRMDAFQVLGTWLKWMGKGSVKVRKSRDKDKWGCGGLYLFYIIKSRKNNLSVEYMHNDCKNVYPQTREEFYKNILQ